VTKNQTFRNVQSADSLNKLTVDSLIMEIEIVANNEFRTSTGETGKKFVGNYLKGFFVEEILENDFQAEQFVPGTNPRIKSLETKIRNLESEEQEMKRDFLQQESILKSLKSDLDFEKDLYKRDKLLSAIKDQESKLDAAFDNGSKVQELKVQIRELRQADRIKNQEKRMDVERKNREGELEPTRFSGVVRFLIIQ